MKYTYDYPKPSVSADCVVFGFDGDDLSVLLIERGQEPYKGRWTFPGGFMNMDETTLQCAARELKEETGLNGLYLEQVGAYSAVDRDPRERVITVAYMSIVKISENNPVAGDDAVNARWFKLKDIPALAFDHDLVLRTAVGRLKDGFKEDGSLAELAGKMFSSTELGKLTSVIDSLDYEPYKPE
ncbi:MAG: NUDIX domain-containing protein [Bacteroidales bacterium]